jgi:outer membrane receptor protein involved in Fe transport
MRRVNPIILSTVSFAALSASPAFAQQTQADTSPPAALQSEQEIESGAAAPSCQVPAGTPLPPGCTPASNEAITVTGSRIRRPNLDSPLPVTSVGGEEFFQTGNVSIGDKLAEVPSIRTTFTQANSTRGLGISGLNILDLRGLGILRTLVLVNGRRHVGGDVLLTGVAVDVNTIPTDLIDRVDVVTGGNSAVYGSDAIAGVVNFVLKQDYDGIMMRAQGGESKYGDANAYFLSALVGKNFAEGRGNVAVNLEYARRDQAWGSDRKWFRESYAINDSDPSGSDGNPDEILNRDFRSATFNNTGNIRFGGNGGTLNCTSTTAPGNLTCPFIFLPNGQLVPQTGTRIGIGPNGQFIGGNGEGFFEGHQIQITPQLDRYNINALGHFDITPAVVPFFEAKYSRTDSSGTGANGPAFIAGGSAFFDPFKYFGGYDRERISINNPYLSPQARQTIIDQRALNGQTTPDATRLVVQESLLGLQNRTEDARRNTYRIVGGVRGDLGSSWNYEVSLNYGQLKEKTKIKGNLDVQRMLLAMDAVRDPATGNIVCASKINPANAFGYWPWVYGTDPNADARLAADIAACTPVNVLGDTFTQAQRDYLLHQSTTVGKTSQFDALAFIAGDSSKWFELPGGPIGIVLGAEYRTNDLYYHLDNDIQLGYTFYNAIPTFDAPKTKVKEAFGEIRLPIIKDRPFLQEVEVSGAARVSDYNGSTGTVWAYNGNAVWAPVKGLRFRGNYARSVRAPNQVELFTPFGQNFALIQDPCDVNNVGAGTQYRAANCIASGVPAGTALTYASSLSFLSGGNPDLQAEKSDSITVGGVFQPSFIPGLSASVDYYSIKVAQTIQALGAQQILNSCYDLPDLNNPFCSLFQRAGPGQPGHGGVIQGILDGTLHSAPVNFAKLKTRGIDVEVAYRHQVGNIGRLDTRLTWTHILELTQWIDPTQPDFGDRILSEMGDPQDRFNWNTTVKHGRFNFGYQMRYIGKQIRYDESRGTGAYEDFYGFEGRDAQNEDLFADPWVSAKFYHDVRLGIDVGPKYNFYMGVDNLTNERPAPGASGLGGNTGLYDVIGRFMYAGVSAKF